MGLLREVFGPSQEEVWSELCNAIGADIVRGGFWRGDKVVAKVKDWTIILDTYPVSTGNTTIIYSRMRAPYVNKDNFRFKIYREGILSRIGKTFGMQDIEVGFPDFDKEFIIKGNDPQRLIDFFSNQRIRELIQIQKDIFLEVKDDEGWFGTEFPDGVDELLFQVPGIIKDIEKLKGLYHLFSEVLNHLCTIGSAYDSAPRVNLQ